MNGSPHSTHTFSGVAGAGAAAGDRTADITGPFLVGDTLLGDTLACQLASCDYHESDPMGACSLQDGPRRKIRKAHSLRSPPGSNGIFPKILFGPIRLNRTPENYVSSPF